MKLIALLSVPAGALAVVAILLPTSEGPADAAYAGTNGQIAFINAFGQDVWIMNSDGTDRTQITQSNGADFQPSWSPDGTKVAFRRNGTSSGLYTVNPDGSGEQKIPGTESAFTAAWSPTGDRLAVSTLGGDIATLQLDGSGFTNLTNTDDIEEKVPDWSPLGDKIVFQGSSDAGVDLFVMNTDGSDVVQLTTTPNDDESHPDWSPDGARIIFQLTPEGQDDRDIAVVNADGTGFDVIADGPADQSDPVYSPDGQKIAYVQHNFGFVPAAPAGLSDDNIVVANQDGSDPVDISQQDLPADISPDWGVDEPAPPPTPTPTGPPAANALWADDDCNLTVAATDALKKLQDIASIPYNVEPGCPSLGDVVGVQPDGYGDIVWGDTDCDGDYDAVDALQVLRHIAGLKVTQTEPCPHIGEQVILS